MEIWGTQVEVLFMQLDRQASIFSVRWEISFVAENEGRVLGWKVEGEWKKFGIAIAEN